MADKVTPKQERVVDPVGLEPLLPILSTVVTTVSVIVTVAALIRSKKPATTKDLRRKISKLRDNILSLHNWLDDLILTVQRHARQQTDAQKKES